MKKNPLSSVRVLVDGYNLMMGSVIVPSSKDRNLQKAREYFLDQIANQLSEAEQKETWIVFDSSRSGEANNSSIFRNMKLIFASKDLSADDCLIDLIRTHTSPRKLTVVSSDHQIQRRALARGATAIDSDLWLESLAKNRTAQVNVVGTEETQGLEKPVHSGDAKDWLRRFGFETNRD